MQMKHFVRLLFILAVFFFASHSKAVPPKYVYRVDTRPPSQIFNSGFSAWGSNDNIVAHINGGTCSVDQSTSAFISTATNTNAMEQLAQQHLREREVTYIYRIRADQTFYSGPASIDWLQQQSGSSSPLSVQSLEMARRADEWDALYSIPTENIVEAVEVRNTGTRVISNSRYLNVDTTGNSAPYTRNAQATLEHYGFSLASPGFRLALFSSCFASCAGSSTSSGTKRSVSGVDSCANEPERIMNLNALMSLITKARYY